MWIPYIHCRVSRARLSAGNRGREPHEYWWNIVSYLLSGVESNLNFKQIFVNKKKWNVKSPSKNAGFNFSQKKDKNLVHVFLRSAYMYFVKLFITEIAIFKTNGYIYSHRLKSTVNVIIHRDNTVIKITKIKNSLAHVGTRTQDPQIKSLMLYRLSYAGFLKSRK